MKRCNLCLVIQRIRHTLRPICNEGALQPPCIRLFPPLFSIFISPAAIFFSYRTTSGSYVILNAAGSLFMRVFLVYYTLVLRLGIASLCDVV